MENNGEEEREVLSGSGTGTISLPGKIPLYIRLAQLVNGWQDMVIWVTGTERTYEWKYMTDKQRVAYLKDMLKEYE